MRWTRWTGLVAACLFAAPVAAELILYTHEGNGSGTLDGEPFADADFVITAVADTDDTVPLLPYSTFITHLEADITIDGVGTLELTEPTTTLVDHLFGGVAFGILLDFGDSQEPGPVMSGPIEPVLAVWDMTTSIGPITGSGLHEAWMARPVDTPEGELIFDKGEFSATFTAEVLAPAIGSDPAGLSSELGAGQTAILPLTLTNSGQAPLNWEVADGVGFPESMIRPRGRIPAPRIAPVNGAVENLGPVAGFGDGETRVSNPFPVPQGEEIVLTHSESMDMQAENTQVCSPDGGFTTRANQFLRTFAPEDFHVTSDFDVTEVTFGVEILRDATAEIDVNLYTLDGEFVYANMDLIGTATAELEPQEMTLVTVPVTGTVPAGSTLVVEIAAPELGEVGAFFPGSNGDGETAPSYLAASDCGFPEPRPYSVITETPVHLVMTVTGNGTVDLPDCELPGWAAIDPLSGSVSVGGQQMVDVTFDAGALASGEYNANLCLTSNDPDLSLMAVPLDLTVTGEPGGASPVHVPAMSHAGMAMLVLMMLALGGWMAGRGRVG